MKHAAFGLQLYQHSRRGQNGGALLLIFIGRNLIGLVFDKQVGKFLLLVSADGQRRGADGGQGGNGGRLRDGCRALDSNFLFRLGSLELFFGGGDFSSLLFGSFLSCDFFGFGIGAGTFSIRLVLGVGGKFLILRLGFGVTVDGHHGRFGGWFYNGSFDGCGFSDGLFDRSFSAGFGLSFNGGRVCFRILRAQLKELGGKRSAGGGLCGIVLGAEGGREAECECANDYGKFGKLHADFLRQFASGSNCFSGGWVAGQGELVAVDRCDSKSSLAIIVNKMWIFALRFGVGVC